MAITSLDDYIAAAKRRITFMKSAARTTVAGTQFSVFDLAGNPGAGTLAIGNTANGVVHTSATAGYPAIPNSGGTLYISILSLSWSVQGRIMLYDRLFACGAYAYNADVTLASQPSYASRLPIAGDYKGLQLWIETVTAFTGTPSFEINYLDQDGNAGDTGVISAGSALTVGRCFHMPLQTGDSGIQQITRVRCTVATAGTFNVMVLRPLAVATCAITGLGEVQDLLRTGLPRIFPDTALYALVETVSTSSGVPQLMIEVAEG
jgi:hypothetical protein